MPVVTAIHTFVAEHGDELEFQAGDIIEVLERDDGFGDGWWRGRNAQGEEGLFPATYITEGQTPPESSVKDTSHVADAPGVLSVPHAPDEDTAPAKGDLNKEPTPPQPTGGVTHYSQPVEPAVEQVDEDVTHPVIIANPPPNGNDPTGDVAGSIVPAIRDVTPGSTAIAAPATFVAAVAGNTSDADAPATAAATRARLAAQAQLANEQRDLHRSSGGISGLVYSDESEDEEESPPSSPTRLNVANGSHNRPSLEPAALVTPAAASPTAPSMSPGDSTLAQQGNSPSPSHDPVSTWSIDRVVEWAQSSGFESTICEKFREHEITGDLLIGLDANLLKELDIPQFGKRLRIAQAIDKLRPSDPLADARGPLMPSFPSPDLPRPSTPGADPAYSAWTHSRRTSSTTPATMTAIREGVPASHASQSSPASSIPPSSTPAATTPSSPITPSSTAQKRESVGSMGHKRGKASVDRDRLSFFGRKKPPQSPQFASTRRTSATPHSSRPHSVSAPVGTLVPGAAMTQIGTPDHASYIKKKTDYGTWKTRYAVLKGSHIYLMKNASQDRVKGNISLQGYRVLVDENTNPGSYGFRLVGEKPHYFSSSEQLVVREWLKALMKATIARDYTVPVTSSCNIPTIPLAEAQALAPRPPSPATRDATQRATRRENVTQLTPEDATILMGPPRPDRRSSSAPDAPRVSVPAIAPPYSSSAVRSSGPGSDLLSWVNANLPAQYPRAASLPGSFVSGEVIFLLVRALSGIEPNPPVPPNAFAPEGGKPGVSGLFAMMDLLIDAGVDTVGVSLNDIREGDTESIVRLLKSVKSWHQ